MRRSADDTGAFTTKVGMLFDASGLLGNHRAQRYVAVVENGKVVSLPLPSLSLCRYVRL